MGHVPLRRIGGDHAARLIEAAGLKGTGVGRARVSEKHANFIVASDGATVTNLAGGPWFEVAATSKSIGVLAAPPAHHGELLRRITGG